MKYAVIWIPEAETELAEIWLAATDRAVITNTTREIEFLLETNPLLVGESREENHVRVLFIAPLMVGYLADSSNRTVYVFSIRRTIS